MTTPTIFKTKKATYRFFPGAGGGINQHMSKERRAKKQARYKANASVRLARSRGEKV